MADLLGVLGGAGTGAKLGSVLDPLVGPLGTIGGAVIGGVAGGIVGGKREKEMNEAMAGIMAIPEIDPNMIQFKDQLAREKKMIDTGLNTSFQVARDIALQSEAGGMSVAAELAMTNPAVALMMMNQISEQTDVSINKALGTLSTQSMGYTQMLSDFIDKISQRQFDVQRLKAAQKMAIATTKQKDFNANMWAGLMQGIDVLSGLEGLKIPGKTIKNVGRLPDEISEIEPIGGGGIT